MKDGLHLSPHGQARTHTVASHQHTATLTQTHSSVVESDRNPCWRLCLCTFLHLMFAPSCRCDCYSVTGEMVCIPGVSNDVCINCWWLLWWDKGCPGAISVTSTGNWQNTGNINKKRVSGVLSWHQFEECKRNSCARHPVTPAAGRQMLNFCWAI